jgi:hypothetical protein
MAPTPPATKANQGNAPQWLIDSFKHDGFKFDNKGNIVGMPSKKDKPVTNTSNTPNYNAAQNLKGVTRGSSRFDTSDIPGFGGLTLSGVGKIDKKGEGIPLGSFSTDGGMGKGLHLFAGGRHIPHGPSLHFVGGSHSDSSPSAPTGPGKKAGPTVHTPSFTPTMTRDVHW